jgi:hypothetical protein
LMSSGALKHLGQPKSVEEGRYYPLSCLSLLSLRQSEKPE